MAIKDVTTTAIIAKVTLVLMASILIKERISD
jgi:hypothetical protein